MLKFFRCLKCGWQCFCSVDRAKSNLQCGAVVEYIPSEDSDSDSEDMIRSTGLKPLGCGGKMVEITQEEAMSYDPRE